MATKAFAYDNPIYQVPVIYSGSIAAGANGVTDKFAAFTAQKIKSVTFGPAVVGTSATTPLLYVKSGTTTTTTTLTALTSATTVATNQALSTAATLAQGDQFWVTHGTDATIVSSVAVETYVIPGSTVTA